MKLYNSYVELFNFRELQLQFAVDNNKYTRNYCNKN